MYASKYTISGAVGGFVAGIFGGKLIHIAAALAVAFLFWLLNRAVEHAFESRIGISGGFLVVVLSSPFFSSLSSAATGILKFFSVFVLTLLGFFVGQFFENRTLIEDDSLGE
jgi:hypothetical protein